MDILAEQAAHGALVLISTQRDHIARSHDRAISLDSTENATEVLPASIHAGGRLDLASGSVSGRRSRCWVVLSSCRTVGMIVRLA
jgi:hypothetical protein